MMSHEIKSPSFGCWVKACHCMSSSHCSHFLSFPQSLPTTTTTNLWEPPPCPATVSSQRPAFLALCRPPGLSYQAASCKYDWCARGVSFSGWRVAEELRSSAAERATAASLVGALAPLGITADHCPEARHLLWPGWQDLSGCIHHPAASETAPLQIYLKGSLLSQKSFVIRHAVLQQRTLKESEYHMGANEIFSIQRGFSCFWFCQL